MKFSKGDRVRFLNEKGEGTISRISGQLAFVDVNGFEIPFPLAELVPAFTEDNFRKPNQSGPPAPKTPEPSLPPEIPVRHRDPGKDIAEGVFLAFVPINQMQLLESPLQLFLINATAYHILYSCSVKISDGYTVINSGRLDAGAEMLLRVLQRSDIEKYGQVKTDVIFFSDHTYDHQPPMSELVRMRPVKFYKESTYTENPFFEAKAYVTPVSGTDGTSEEDYHDSFSKQDFARLILEKERNQKRGGPAPRPPVNTGELEQEIDLHIEELLDDIRGMSNTEIITIQLRHFRYRLEEAIAGHVRKITFIHGVGNGRLKHEVRRILATYEGIRFHDAPYHRYGFGATEVVIR